MSKVKINKGDWIVVCDGQKALVLENVGDEKFPNLKTIQAIEEKHGPGHDLGSAPSGRAYSTAGTARGSVEETDRHDQSERQFLEKLVTQLDAAVLSGKAKSLIMVAPPRALGMMRQTYSKHIQGALRAEIDKDLVKMPVYEIEKYLAG